MRISFRPPPIFTNFWRVLFGLNRLSSEWRYLMEAYHPLTLMRCKYSCALTCCLRRNVALHPSSDSECKITALFLSSSTKLGESEACCSEIPPFESEDDLIGSWGMSLFKRSVTPSFSFNLFDNAFRRLFRSLRSLLLYASGILWKIWKIRALFYLRPRRSIRWTCLVIIQQTHFLVSSWNIGFSW